MYGSSNLHFCSGLSLEYGTHFFPRYCHDPNHGFKWAFFIAESLHEFQIHTHTQMHRYMQTVLCSLRKTTIRSSPKRSNIFFCWFRPRVQGFICVILTYVVRINKHKFSFFSCFRCFVPTINVTSCVLA